MSGPVETGGVIGQESRIAGLKSERGFEIMLRLGKVSMICFVLAGEKVSGRGEFGLAFALKDGEGIRVDFAIANDLIADIRFVAEGGGGRGEFRDVTGTGGAGVLGRNASGVDAVDG